MKKTWTELFLFPWHWPSLVRVVIIYLVFVRHKVKRNKVKSFESLFLEHRDWNDRFLDADLGELYRMLVRVFADRWPVWVAWGTLPILTNAGARLSIRRSDSVIHKHATAPTGNPECGVIAIYRVGKGRRSETPSAFPTVRLWETIIAVTFNRPLQEWTAIHMSVCGHVTLKTLLRNSPQHYFWSLRCLRI